MIALAGVVDDRVLHVERMRRDHPLDEVLFPATVQGEAEAAREDPAAFLDERRQASLMFCSPGNPLSPVVGNPRVARQLIAPGP